MAAPDLTAVGAAYGRAAHVLFDEPPLVLDDAVSIRLADEDTLRAAQLWAPEGGLLATRDEPRARWRGTFVARARLVEDVVEERLAAGVSQLVILGAGLDTFAERRSDLTPRLRIFEVDEPGTQRWKQERLRALGLPIPVGLYALAVLIAEPRSGRLRACTWLAGCFLVAGFLVVAAYGPYLEHAREGWQNDAGASSTPP